MELINSNPRVFDISDQDFSLDLVENFKSRQALSKTRSLFDNSVELDDEDIRDPITVEEVFGTSFIYLLREFNMF